MAYTGDEDAAGVILDGLKKLEYRGYDSAGIATVSDNPGLTVKKGEGKIDELDTTYDFGSMTGTSGIGHTRWATHGGVSQANAHPHTSCDDRLVLVHNGIIENHKAIAERLEDDHSYTSDTDSEIIAHYLEEQLHHGVPIQDAIEQFMETADGTFAIVLLDTETDTLYALKRKSPLVLGEADHGIVLGSDLYAIAPYTDEALFFEDDEYAIIQDETFTLYDADGREQDPSFRPFDWDVEGAEKGSYDHYMLKEINEQPQAIKRLAHSLGSTQEKAREQLAQKIEDASRVIFTAAGSSYHASLMGVYHLQAAGIEAQALIASEFKNYERVDEDTLVIAVSQSGETMDVIEAIEYSKDRGGEVASIVNVPHSTIQRKSSVSLEICAGQEVCVASTKTFTNQVVTMLSLAATLRDEDHDIAAIGDEIAAVIEHNIDRVQTLASELEDADDIYVLGRGSTYPIAREIALKLKEIPYIHAEGMMGGELKHGTLALIEDGTPVISLIPTPDDPIESNVEEVEARGAHSIRVTPHGGQFDLEANEDHFALYATTIGFLLSYYIAKAKDLPIDKPRNLAKSVTVT
ncbi:MAG: glutamine--fructose-6-phosphate transaminase (isomerizing) [Candidatus Nanohaloarchaeota archaeon QJJ-5]|nr:glutamine--fructose-6-phosphate transaminase (isomerizing) [Candidatus Nanohaloarchaeota archaeon QJJ-5]